MASATWIPAYWGASALVIAWVTAATINYRGAPVGREAVDRFVAFQATGQAGFAVLTVVAVGVLLVRRPSLELGRVQ
jgi:hypothetical protein